MKTWFIHVLLLSLISSSSAFAFQRRVSLAAGTSLAALSTAALGMIAFKDSIPQVPDCEEPKWLVCCTKFFVDDVGIFAKSSSCSTVHGETCSRSHILACQDGFVSITVASYKKRAWVDPLFLASVFSLPLLVGGAAFFCLNANI